MSNPKRVSRSSVATPRDAEARPAISRRPSSAGRPHSNDGGAVVVELEGKPVAKGRPRFGKGNVYTPDATAGYEQALAWQARRAMRGREIFAGAVSMSIVASIEIPLSWSGTKQAKARSGELYPISRPDLDNYGKAARDALNGIVYRDDAQVCFTMESKIYSDRPGIRIEISELGKGSA